MNVEGEPRVLTHKFNGSPIDLWRLFPKDQYRLLLENQTDSRRRVARLFLDPLAACFGSRGGVRTVDFKDGAETRSDDPFVALRALLGRRQTTEAGGLAGYFTYDIRTWIYDLPDQHPHSDSLHDFWFGLFDTVVELDVEDARIKLTLWPRPNNPEGDLETRLKTLIDTLAAFSESGSNSSSHLPRGHLKILCPRDLFEDRLLKIREYIRCGHVYQVNFTHPVVVEGEFDPATVFDLLRRTHAAPYAALFQAGDAAVVSASPECFLRVEGSFVESRPIKGTIPRAVDPEADKIAAQILAHSVKDRAELAMIVDLIRNDLNRVCRPGSVEVLDHAHIESAPTVHHLVTEVRGELEEGRDVFDLLKASLPGGSITGCPKIRAMEIIDELELSRRGIYTGNIGTLEWNGKTDLSVAIRTMVIRKTHVSIHGGGGITWLSDPGHEYTESLSKVAGLIHSLGAEPAP